LSCSTYPLEPSRNGWNSSTGPGPNSPPATPGAPPACPLIGKVRRPGRPTAGRCRRSGRRRFPVGGRRRPGPE
jgi:hypothetical protein